MSASVGLTGAVKTWMGTPSSPTAFAAHYEAFSFQEQDAVIERFAVNAWWNIKRTLDEPDERDMHARNAANDIKCLCNDFVAAWPTNHRAHYASMAAAALTDGLFAAVAGHAGDVHACLEQLRDWFSRFGIVVGETSAEDA